MKGIATHNSLTSYPMLGWQRYIPFLGAFTRCQSRDIEQQLSDGVRFFQFQIARYNGVWIGSHGIAWFDITIKEAMFALYRFVCNTGETVKVQLMYDHRFFAEDHTEEFLELCEYFEHEHPRIIISSVYLEHPWTMIKNDGTRLKENYWRMNWAKKWYHRLPLPKFWAKRYNKEWRKDIENCEYLMLDFYEI